MGVKSSYATELAILLNVPTPFRLKRASWGVLIPVASATVLGSNKKDDLMKRISLAAALLAAAPGVGMAQQQDIQWTQTINVPKGANMPRDRADILGIELGDTYAESKAKLERLASEGVQPMAQRQDLASRMTARMDGQANAQPIREERRIYEFRTPGASSAIRASFVQVLTMSRQLTSQSGKRYSDSVTVHLSAPSSGHQVIAVLRSVTYGSDEQPLISDTLAQLKSKMKAEPQVLNTGAMLFRFQFDNGKSFTPANPTANGCTRTGFSVADEVYVKNINESGTCDAHMDMMVQTGISRDHAGSLSFTLSDNDRARANLAADFAFLSDYVRSVQQNTRAAPPKL